MTLLHLDLELFQVALETDFWLLFLISQQRVVLTHNNVEFNRLQQVVVLVLGYLSRLIQLILSVNVRLGVGLVLHEVEFVSAVVNAQFLQLQFLVKRLF